MRCRACAHNCPRTSSVLRPPVRFTLRSAHAAARPLDENDSASSGSGSVANSESTAAAQRPVDPPRRVRRSGMDPLPGYQFPQTGKQGGSPDPYEILALDRHATDKDIKRRSMMLHPDSAHPQASADHFAALSRAYTLLSDGEARARYLSTGTGWSGTHENTSGASDLDTLMRAEATRRYRARFRESDGGRGAWKFDGKQDSEHDQGSITAPSYKLVAGLSLVIMVAAFGRWQDIHTSQEKLVAEQNHRHFVASTALRSARTEASLFGHERREQIRRRVQENKTLDELESLASMREAQPQLSIGAPESG